MRPPADVDAGRDDDPYPYYAHLRAEAPVPLHEQTGLRLVSRYSDVDAALRDRRFGRTFVPEEPAEALRPSVRALAEDRVRAGVHDVMPISRSPSRSP